MTKKSVSQLEWHLRLQSLLDGWRNGQITLSKELTERKIWDELPAYNPPRDCIQPPKDAYVLHVYENEEKLSTVPLTQKCMVLGSAKDINGQILDTTSPTVNRQHAALLYMKGKMYFKPINGGATVHYVGDFPYLKGTKLTCANPAKASAACTTSGYIPVNS